MRTKKMRTKKVTVQGSPVLAPDSVVMGKKKKGGPVEYKTMKLFANVAKVLSPPTRDFLAMGVDELSVSPGRILPIRKIVLETDVSAYKKDWRKSWK